MIKNGPAALAQPDNYEARANLMWAGTHAINGVVGDGCSPAWCVHPMEHELSASMILLTERDLQYSHRRGWSTY